MVASSQDTEQYVLGERRKLLIQDTNTAYKLLPLTLSVFGKKSVEILRQGWRSRAREQTHTAASYEVHD